MSGYILDTEVLVWFLEKNSRLPKSIREDIEYFQYGYFVSFLSLMEMDNLNKLGKIKLEYSFKEIIKQLQDANIGIYFGAMQDLETLDAIEMKIINKKTHGDYIDRMIIATSIACRHTLISSDKKFPYYREHGLKLLEI